MPVTRKQEIWALALWVERTHVELGASFIAERIVEFEAEGSPQAVALWGKVAKCHGSLGEGARLPV